MKTIIKWLKYIFSKKTEPSKTRASYSLYVDGSPIPTSGAGGAVHFNYLMMSKAYTTGNIGFAVEERDATKKFSCGGYETSDASLQNGTVYIDLIVPRTAIDYSSDNCFEFTFLGNSTTSTECKLDINIYQSDEDMANAVQIYTQSAYTVSSDTEPVALKINKSALLAPLSGKKRITIQLEFYSKSSKSIKLISGACNFS